ncbi:MAG: hypothetical protein H5U33_01570, partial [Pseudomonas sp.]|nr:hypothetical protein [Pseudomonas sp.]
QVQEDERVVEVYLGR